MRRAWTILIFLAVALLGALSLGADRSADITRLQDAANAVVTDESVSVKLGRHLRILVDETGRLTQAEALQASESGRFVQSQREIPSYGLTTDVAWVRLEFEDQRRVPTP